MAAHTSGAASAPPSAPPLAPFVSDDMVGAAALRVLLPAAEARAGRLARAFRQCDDASVIALLERDLPELLGAGGVDPLLCGDLLRAATHPDPGQTRAALLLLAGAAAVLAEAGPHLGGPT